MRRLLLFIFILLLNCTLINNSGNHSGKKKHHGGNMHSTTDSSLNSTSVDTLETTNLKKLTTNGKLIIEKDSGNIVNLRGVTFTGGVWVYPFGTIDQVSFMTTEWDFQKIKSWGTNVISFYMDYHWFNSNEGFLFMDKILNLCRKYNIYIVPTLNVLPLGGNRGGPKSFESEKAKNQVVEFWKNYTKRYKDRDEIAGYCILDEPHAEGSTIISSLDFPGILKNYMERIIDEIRIIDDITPIQIQCIYGNPNNFIEINSSKTHIVYNIHFYEPWGFTAMGFPWFYNGGIKTDVSYPGNYIEKIIPVKPFSYNANDTSGSFDWTKREVSVIVPDNTEYAFIQVFCTGDFSSTIYFDNIEYSINGGLYQLFPNGSFEDVEYYEDPKYWLKYNANGKVERTNEAGFDGNYSIKFTNCIDWSDYYTYNDFDPGWLATEGSIIVNPGQTLKISYWVKGTNAVSGKYGLQICWGYAQRQWLDKTKVHQLINSTIIDRRNNLNRPFFIGEFSPSLVGIRPDIINYLNDVADYFNENNIHWTFYPMRECWINPLKYYMGIYNGSAGLTTDQCPIVDNEIINLLLTKF